MLPVCGKSSLGNPSDLIITAFAPSLPPSIAPFPRIG